MSQGIINYTKKQITDPEDFFYGKWIHRYYIDRNFVYGYSSDSPSTNEANEMFQKYLDELEKNKS